LVNSYSVAELLQPLDPNLSDTTIIVSEEPRIYIFGKKAWITAFEAPHINCPANINENLICLKYDKHSEFG